MSAMREYLLSEIQRREHDLDALGREVRSIEVRKAVLDAELVLLRDMLSRADGTPEIGMAAVTDQPPRRSPARAGKSRLSQRWACVVMNAIKRYPAEIGTADVPDIQKSAGQPEGSGNQIRSHFWAGVESGLYERASYGTVRATPLAAEVLGIPLGSQSAPAEPSSPKGEPGSGQPRLDLNHSESVEAAETARKEGGT